MKIFSKIIITLFVFFMITNVVYGNGDILPENKFGIKKAITLAAGIFLVVQILFISYKKDMENEVSVDQGDKDSQEKSNDKDIQIFEEKELNRIQREEQNLFSQLNEVPIETLPSDSIKEENSQTKKATKKKETNTKSEKQTKSKKEKDKKDSKENKTKKKNTNAKTKTNQNANTPKKESAEDVVEKKKKSTSNRKTTDKK